MTDNAPTAKDAALASDLIALRRELLTAREVRTALARLARTVASALACEHPPPGAWLGYWLDVGRLHRDLDRVFSEAELDAFARDWTAISARIRAGWVPAGLGYSAGRVGRGRRQSPPTVKLAARALALRANGNPAARADEQAAQEDRGTVDPETVAVYRMRLRDRLR